MADTIHSSLQLWPNLQIGMAAGDTAGVRVFWTRQSQLFEASAFNYLTLPHHFAQVALKVLGHGGFVQVVNAEQQNLRASIIIVDQLKAIVEKIRQLQ